MNRRVVLARRRHASADLRQHAERALSPLATCGALVVLALVLALPLVLAFCPVEALTGQDGMSGVGAGTGDEVAAAVSSLDRQLQDSERLPPPARRGHTPGSDSPFLAPSIERGALLRTGPPRSGSRPGTPGDARVGLTDLGHQLLL